MNIILDTHIFIWALFEPEKIPKKLRFLILDPQSTSYISIITFWEISLKFQLGKLDLAGILPDALPDFAKKAGFEIMELSSETASSFYKLPRLKNKDPFDRMLTWQAIQNDCQLVTKDQDFTSYQEYGLKIAH